MLTLPLVGLRERVPFNHSVIRSVILGLNGPGDATIDLDTG